MRIHKLKIQQCYLENILNGRKTFEIRYNDRDYQVGDRIWFLVADRDIESCKYKITYIHAGLGLKDGYVALAIQKEGE